MGLVPGEEAIFSLFLLGWGREGECMFGLMHCLSKGGTHGCEEWYCAALVSGLAPAAGQRARGDEVGCCERDEGLPKRLQLVGKHRVGPGEGVDVDTGEGPALGHGLALLIREGEVEGACLGAPEGFGRDGPVVGAGTYLASALVAGAWGMRRGAYREVKVADPRGDVHGIGQPADSRAK
jgi:hypothetical protein